MNQPGTELGEASRLEEAVEWLALLRCESPSEEEITRWLQWCDEDPRNQVAFDRMQELWRLTGGLAKEVSRGELINARGRPITSTGWVAKVADLANAAVFGIRHSLGAHRRSVALGAASTLLCVAGGAWMARDHIGLRPLRDEAVVATAAREVVHEAKLSDGSRIELAAKSQVAVHYSSQRRSLELQDGEAYFAVAPNKKRPFIVMAGRLRVRAVGTEFDVRRLQDRIVVTVTHGTVDVYQGGDTSDGTGDVAHVVQISAGNQVNWLNSDADPIVAAVDPARAVGWREGRLEYTNEPLSAVIADFNRYSDRPAIIEGDAIKHLRFSGTLLTASTEEWIHALPGEFPVRVREDNGTFIVEPRSERD